MTVIGYIVDKNINDIEGDPEYGRKHARIIDVHELIRGPQNSFVYTGIRHGSETTVRHKQYEEAKLHTTLASAQAVVDAWVKS